MIHTGPTGLTATIAGAAVITLGASLGSLPPVALVGGALVAGSVATGGIARVNDTVKAGRKTRVESGGPDSYQFGDVTRGVLAKGRAGTNRTGYKFGDFSKVSLCSVHYTPEGDYHWPYNIISISILYIYTHVHSTCLMC